VEFYLLLIRSNIAQNQGLKAAMSKACAAIQKDANYSKDNAKFR